MTLSTNTSAICPQAIPDWMCTETITWENDWRTEDVKEQIVQMCKLGMDKLLNDPRQTEDCLTLDLFVPQGVFEGENCPGTAPLAPVVIFLGHSLPFVSGHKNEFTADGVSPAVLTSHAANEDPCGTDFPVVVAINSRLGLFGFFGDHASSANAGLWDQRLAMEWVHAHIESFGGDPNRITIHGVGPSTMLHVTAFAGRKNPNPAFYHPEAYTPFSSGIVMTPYWDFTPDPVWIFQRVSSVVYEVSRRITLAADHIRALDSATLMEVNRRVTKAAPSLKFMFGPTIGGDFIPYHPGVMFRERLLNDSIQIVTGSGFNDMWGMPKRATSREEVDAQLSSFLYGFSNTTLEFIEKQLYNDSVREELVNRDGPTLAAAPDFVVLSEAQILQEIQVGCNIRNLAQALPNSTYVYDAGQMSVENLLGIFRFPEDQHGAFSHGLFNFRQSLLNFIQGREPLPGVWEVYGQDKTVLHTGSSPTWGRIWLARDIYDNERCRWWQEEGYDKLREESPGYWL
ncbi:Carboxylesterase family-domain-containing protein [Podospora appendiculata]|uniref:Carboxylesterase family-domain-containing protein n=1 Tax=Podospora appendiculata TaxID=314037 RepID=A0AAE1CGN9_9PEZI|nr:Carboxylesterase family-domain-containing protein [Podospora appendiculata]